MKTEIGVLHRTSSLLVAAGEVAVIEQTTALDALTVAEGGSIEAPPGYAITLTVNGVETGHALRETTGVESSLRPGRYTGDVVLTVTRELLLGESRGPEFPFHAVYPFRQAILVDPDGIDPDLSVPAAVRGGTYDGRRAEGVVIASTGEMFSGIHVQDCAYDIDRALIRFNGNGRYDFVGVGAAILASGSNARVVVDRSDIETHGVVRTAVLADRGAQLLVKNTRIQAHDGELPADYVPTVEPGQFRSCPWMLGVGGNVRATNMLGLGTRATYLNCTLGSTRWGVLSTDSSESSALTAINTVATTGAEGYGAYADLRSIQMRLLGCTFDVADIGVISTGGEILITDSSRELVREVNDALEIGLSGAEIDALVEQPTRISSGRFGFMSHGAGAPDGVGAAIRIAGGSQISSRETMFVSKGVAQRIEIDGSDGASLTADNQVLLQVMDSDSPEPIPADGKLFFPDFYQEPEGPAAPLVGYDATALSERDVVLDAHDIALDGDLFNGSRLGRTLVVRLRHGSLTGLITSSEARHHIDPLTAEHYHEVSRVTNRPQPAVNNGVVLALGPAAVWTVTGRSHLTGLSLDETADVRAADGCGVSVRVDGRDTILVPGAQLTGAIVVAPVGSTLPD